MRRESMTPYKRLLAVVISYGMGLMVTPLTALADVDEDSLFLDAESIVARETVMNDDVTAQLRENSFSFSQQVDTSISMVDAGGNILVKPTVSGLLSLDHRKGDGTKSYLSLGLEYAPNGTTQAAIKEFFVDTDWRDKVYIRAGKQNLKWGRGYVWNPTDLISMGKKDLMKLTSASEGIFGLRLHAPEGVERNTYVFINAEAAETLDDVSLSAKHEFLSGRTEMAVSVWAKKNSHPVYGFDISSRIGDTEVYGELSLTDGDNERIMDYGTLALVNPSGFIPKACVGLSKSFGHNEIKDRISLTGEFFYNGAGYSQNILQRLFDIGSEEQQLTYMLDIYKPFSSSKYYVALFGNIKRFLHNDVSLDASTITNIVDRSAVISSGLTYHPTAGNYSVTLRVDGNIGEALTEAALAGIQYGVTLGAGFTF